VFYGVLIATTATVVVFGLVVRGLRPIPEKTISAVEVLNPKPGNELAIPSLNLTVPLTQNVSGTDEEAYLAALEHGVAHMADSAKPNELGNVFIFGHSSYFKHKPGDYKEVFRNLDQLKAGGRFFVYFDEIRYDYEVVETTIVKPTDWSIAEPHVDGVERTLTLMTCWPPGSLAKRYAVIAKQLSSTVDQ